MQTYNCRGSNLQCNRNTWHQETLPMRSMVAMLYVKLRCWWLGWCRYCWWCQYCWWCWDCWWCQYCWWCWDFDDVNIVDDVDFVDGVDEESWGGYCWGDSRLAEATNKWSKKQEAPTLLVFSRYFQHLCLHLIIAIVIDDGPSFDLFCFIIAQIQIYKLPPNVGSLFWHPCVVVIISYICLFDVGKYSTFSAGDVLGIPAN